jgi:RNA ligase (TIGR02306 family)
MSTFEVAVHPITISEHPNADALSLGAIEGQAWQFIVAKGLYNDGDLGAFIPEGSVVPAPIIAEMDLDGKLSGAERNRVKAVRLRGILSQGLFYRPTGPRA